MNLLFFSTADLRRRDFLARLFFVFALFFIFSSGAHAGYQQYLPGDTVTIGEFIYDDNFQATTSDNCSVTVYNPSGSTVVNAASMTIDSNSWHHYSFTPASVEGIWPAYISCGTLASGDLVKEDRTFQITSNIVSSTSVASLVNTNTNSAILTASSSLGASLPLSIWSYSARTLSSFGTLVADIWASGTRTLTSGTAIAADVWASATRTLTGAGLTTGSLATNSDINNATSSVNATVTTASTSIAAAITAGSANVNANTNATVLAASSSLGFSLTSIASSITALPAAVWNVATSTLTGAGTVGKHLVTLLDTAVSGISGGSSLTAADVWSYATRTLTGAGLSSGSLATNSDINNAT
jgi:hypothetical protein